MATRSRGRATKPNPTRERSASTAVADLRIEHVPIDSLHPWEGNPRLMSEGELRKLMRSIQESGFVEPVVVRRQDHTVIGGHQRLEAARRLGHTTVPAVYVEVSEAQAKALNLALNRIRGEWDLPRLGELLEELLDLPELDETLSGFDGKEMEALLADLERQRAPEPREESFPEAAESLQAWREQAPTRVATGELWTLGRHRLLCGDSLAPGAMARLCASELVDLVLTDPPYGIGYQSAQPQAGRRKRKLANDGVGEYEQLLARALPAIRAQLKRGAVLYWFAGGGGGEPVLAKALLAVAEHFTLLNCLVWDKLDPGLGW